MKPVAIISDIHAHNWSAFSTTMKDGLNSRLVDIIKEVNNAVEYLRSVGGDTVFIAGDLFHVRGEIKPSVMNPLAGLFKHLCAEGIKFHVIPGNHDLEDSKTSQLGNAIASLEQENFHVYNETTFLALDGHVWMFLPWCASYADLLKYLEAYPVVERANTSVICHAGINGVIMGMPDHGIDAGTLAKLGYHRIYAGHYHNHKTFEGDKIVSVGAATHQTWSDVGSLAGYIITNERDTEFTFVEGGAPKFIDLNGDDLPDDIEAAVKGNFVRVKLNEATADQVADIKEELTGYGAKGHLVNVNSVATTAERGTAVKTTGTLEETIGTYVDDKHEDNADLITAECLSVLTEARSATE